jgi:hypothetical protein
MGPEPPRERSGPFGHPLDPRRGVHTGYSSTVKTVAFESSRKWEDGSGSHEYEIEVIEGQ